MQRFEYYDCTSFIRYSALFLGPQHFDNQSGHSPKVLLVFRTGEDAETCGSRGRGDGDIVLRDHLSALHQLCEYIGVVFRDLGPEGLDFYLEASPSKRPLRCAARNGLSARRTPTNASAHTIAGTINSSSQGNSRPALCPTRRSSSTRAEVSRTKPTDS